MNETKMKTPSLIYASNARATRDAIDIRISVTKSERSAACLRVTSCELQDSPSQPNTDHELLVLSYELGAKSGEGRNRAAVGRFTRQTGRTRNSEDAHQEASYQRGKSNVFCNTNVQAYHSAGSSDGPLVSE